MSIGRYTSGQMGEDKKHRHLYLTIWVSSCVVDDVKASSIVLIEINIKTYNELS